MPIGRVSHVAEKLVVIHALPGTPPFDEGTVLWSKEKKSLARVRIVEVLMETRTAYLIFSDI